MNCELAGFSSTPENPILHCNYCGSITTGEALILLKTPGTHFSGADWKYGYPHKFYLGNSKFYARHLASASDTELAEFDKLSRKIFGIAWARDKKGIKYQSPKSKSAYGWQLFGVIGADGEPIHQVWPITEVEKQDLAKVLEFAFNN